MATCFIFTIELSEQSILSLRLDDEGAILAPLARRPLAELKMLQQDARTVVVVPTHRCSFFAVELPWLAERRARAALPYALEEQLAQSVTTVHVAFDSAYYQDNHYSVVVIDKAWLADLITQLKAWDVAFDLITLDWFALKRGESCVTDCSLLVHGTTFNGALSAELAAVYLQSHSGDAPPQVFTDSLPALLDPTWPTVDKPSYEWIAARLQGAQCINLCQGEFQQIVPYQKTSRWWYQASAVLLGLWVLVFVVVSGINWRVQHQQIITLDKAIASLYREFFPGAPHVISPKFRISQLLTTGTGAQDLSLWSLLDKVAQALKGAPLTIQQLHFQNKTLSVTLAIKDFAALEHWQHQMTQLGMKVTQTQAASHQQQVIATVELRL